MAPRMTKSKMYSYMRNVGRSFGYAMVDSVKSMNPTVTALFKTTAEQSRDLYQSVKNFDAKSLGFEDSDLKGTLGQAVKDLKNNALEDIRTGKWYNKDRMNRYETEMAQDMFGINFDDFGDFDDFNFEDTDLDEEASITEDATKATVKAMDEVGGKVSTAVSTAAIKSADYIVESNRINTKAIYGLTQAGFSQVNKGVATMNGNLQLLVSLAEPITTHIQNSALFYTKSQEYQNKSLEYLKQIAANTSPKSSNNYKSSSRGKSYTDFITSEGVIDIAALFENGAKRMKENTEMITSMLSFVPGGEKALLKMATASPLQFALTSAISAMFGMEDKQGNSIKKSFENFNKVLADFSLGLLGRAKKATFGDNIFSPFLRGIRDFLLPSDGNIQKKVNSGAYEKGKVDWDGISRRALIEVIPKQLGQILSILENNFGPAGDFKVYDYDKGQFRKTSAIRSGYMADRKRYAQSAGGDLFRDVRSSLQYSGMNKNVQKNYNQQIDALLDYMMVTSNYDILSGNFDFKKAGMSASVAADLQKRIRAIQKSKGGQVKLSGLAGNVYGARNRFDARNRNASNVENVLVDGSINTAGGKILGAVDEYGLTQTEYLRRILGHVSYISKNLKNLVATPGVGGVSADGTQITWEEGDWITKSSDKNTKPSSKADRVKPMELGAPGELNRTYNVDDAVARATGAKPKSPGYTPEEEKVLAKYNNNPNSIPESEPLRDSILRKKNAFDMGQTFSSFGSAAYDRLKSGRFGKVIDGVENYLGTSAEEVTAALDKVSGALNDFVYDNKSGIYALMNAMTGGVLDMIKGLIPKEVRDLISTGWRKIKESKFGKATGETLKNIGLSFFGSNKNKSGYDRSRNTVQEFFGEEEDDAAHYLQNWLEEHGAQGSGLIGRINSATSRIYSNQRSGGNFWGNYSRSVSSSPRTGYAGGRSRSRRRSYRTRKFSGGATGTTDEAAAEPPEEEVSDEAVESLFHRIASKVSASIITKISEVIGKVDPEKEKEKVKGTIDKLMKEAGLAKGSIGAGAVIGAGASLLTGALLGPIASAAIGAGVGFVAKSETAQKFLFGEWDEDSKEFKGKSLLPKAVGKFFKENGVATGKGAGAGMLIGTFMGSPILGTILGATAGYVSSSEKARKALFGEEKDGKLEGGIYSETINIIKKNLNDAIAPITVEVKNKAKDFVNLIVGGISRAAAAVFHKSVASPLMNKINDKVLQPLVNTLTKGVGGLVAAPFRAIGSVGRGIRKKQIRTGRANDMTAKDRLQYRQDNYMDADEFTDFDTILAGMDTEEIDSIVNKVQNAKKSKDPEQMSKAINEFSTKFGLQNVDVNEKNIYKWMDTVTAEGKNRDRSPEAITLKLDEVRNKLMENHYNKSENMLALIVNKLYKRDVFPVTIPEAVTATTEGEEGEISEVQGVTSNTRRNFKNTMKSLFNPFIGMDMESVQQAIAYYEDTLNGNDTSGYQNPAELRSRVKKIEVDGEFRDDIIQVTDKNGYSTTVQKINDSWMPYKFGSQLIESLGNTKIAKVVKGLGKTAAAIGKTVYKLATGNPFAGLDMDIVNKVLGIYLRYRGIYPYPPVTDAEKELLDKHVKFMDELYPGENVIQVTVNGKSAMGRFDEQAGKWKGLGLFWKAGQSVKRVGRLIAGGVKSVGNKIKNAIGGAVDKLRHINPFCDFNPDEVSPILDSLNGMEFNGLGDTTGKIKKVPNLNHYYTVTSDNGVSVTVTAKAGRWIYVSQKDLQTAQSRNVVGGIGALVKNTAKKILNRLFNRNKAGSNDGDIELEGEAASGSGLLGFSGGAFTPFKEKDELASNEGRAKIKRRNTFFGSIAAIPTIGATLTKISEQLEDINEKMGDGEKKATLLDKIKNFLKNGVVPLLIAGLASKVFLDALAGRFDKLFHKFGFGRDRKGLGTDSNAAYSGATAMTADGKEVAIATDEKGNYITDENGNYLSTNGEVLDPSTFKSTDSVATSPFGDRVKSTIARGILTDTPTTLNAVGGLVKKKLNKSIITRGPSKFLAKQGGKAVNAALNKGMGALAGKVTGKAGTEAVLGLTTTMGAQIDDVVKALSKIPLIKNLPLEKLGEALKNTLFKNVSNAGANAGAKLAKNILSTAAFALKIVMVAVDFEEGYNDAYVTFHVNDPTTTEKIISGIIRVLKNLIPFVGLLIPDKAIVDLIVDVFGFDPGDLKKRRQEADDALAAYNEENGTDYSFEEYQKQVLGHYTWGEKIGNGIKTATGKVGNKIKTIGAGIKEKGIVGYASSVISDKASGIVDSIKSKIETFKEQIYSPVDKIVNGEAKLSSFFKVEGLDDEENPMSGVMKAAILTTRIMLLPKTLLAAGISKITGNFMADIKDFKNKTSTFTSALNSFKGYAKNGEVGKIIQTKLLYEDEDGKGSVISKAFGFISNIAKVIYSVSALFHKIINPLKELIDEIKEKGIIKVAYEKAKEGLENMADSASDWIYEKTGIDVSGTHTEETATSGSGSGVISQLDPKYNKYKVGGRSFAANGCGPASAVMATGGDMGSAVRIAQKYQTVGGTDAAYFGEMFNRSGMPAHYYLAGGSSLIGDIAAGKPTVLMGRDIYNTSKANSPFGPNNHYVVANGFDGSGNLLISDPEQRGIRRYDPSILRNVRVGVSGGGPANAPTSTTNTVSPYAASQQASTTTTTKPGMAYSTDTRFTNPKPDYSNYTTIPGVGVRNNSTGYISGWHDRSTSSTTDLPWTKENAYCENLGVWSDISAEEINQWIASSNAKSPFNGHGDIFVEAGKQSGLDPRYILAHAAVESGWGTSNFAKNRNNYFGIGAFDTNPSNAYTFSGGNNGMATGIIEGAKWIARNYYSSKYQQTSVYKMRYNNNVHQYCTSDTWVDSIGDIMAKGPANTKITLAATPIGLSNIASTEHGGTSGTFGNEASNSSGTKKVGIGGILSTITSAFSNAFGKLFNGSQEESEYSQENTQESGIIDKNSSGILGTSGSANGDRVNGFPYYNQTESPWASVPYGTGSTIKSSGCGPTSAAMVLNSYGTYTTPEDAANYSLQHGHRVNGQGTAWGFFNDIGQEAGLTTEQFAEAEVAKEKLNNKIPVIASMKPGDFTKGGHYVVLSKLDNGKLYVNDPASRTRSSKIWDADYALGQAKQFWAISKDGVGSIGTYMATNEVDTDTTKNYGNAKVQAQAEQAAVKQASGNATVRGESAMGSGILRYGPSKAGNYILKDNTRSYYKQGGGASGTVTPVSGGSLLDMARGAVNRTASSAKQSTKDLGNIPANVSAIKQNTSNIDENIAYLATAFKEFMESRKTDVSAMGSGLNSGIKKGRPSSSGQYSTGDYSANQELQNIMEAIVTSAI